MTAMHRYLIRLSNTARYAPQDTVQILAQLRKQVDEFRSVVKNLRITENAIEFDLYVFDEHSKSRSLARLTEKFGSLLTERNLEVDERLESKDGVVKLGISLFNEERYWECHETLEQIWRKQEKGPEKDVQQGVILAASSLVHFQKNERDVCLGMIPRTLARLDQWHEPEYYGLNIEKLKRNLRKILLSGEIATFKI